MMSESAANELRETRLRADRLPPVVAAANGAVFVVHGDLTLVEADAYIASTDADGNVEDWLARVVGSASDGGALQLDDYVDQLRGPGYLWLPATPGVRDTPVLALNVGGVRTVNQVDPVIKRFRAGLQALESQLASVETAWRARPLVAMPLIGTGKGGLRHATGELIDKVLIAVEEHYRDRTGPGGFDVVLVCKSASDYAAVQYRRRAREGDWAVPSWLGAVVKHGQSGSLGVLFGAGVSTGIGLPTWSGLLEHLIGLLDVRDITAAQLSSLDPVDAASILVTMADEERFISALEALLAKPRHALTHALMSNLNPPLAITTNYDQGYELARLGATGALPAVLPWNTAQPGVPGLLKLHGDVYLGKVVLARQDFVAMHAFRRPLAGILQERLLMGHVLTIGTSVSDATLVHAADEVRALIADARDPGDAGPVGTAILTLPDEGRARLLDGTFTVVVAAEVSNEVTQNQVMEAARCVDIVLDWIGMHVSSNTGFLLDPRYRGLLSARDQLVAAKVDEFAASLVSMGGPGTGPIGTQLTGFLDALGWRP